MIIAGVSLFPVAAAWHLAVQGGDPESRGTVIG
jgi:hypothetical protein